MKNRLAKIIAFFLILGVGGSSCGAFKSMGLSKTQPNIIIVLTDDMDLTLLPYMKNTDALIAQKGATFTNYFVAASLCCPSRASMLRGQYPHNTDILSNTSPEGGFNTFFFNGNEAETIAVWLKRAGYKTSLMGKYLNGYPFSAGRDYVPPGWTDWHVFVTQKGNNDFYYNYRMNENGKQVQYGKAAEDYSTDVIKQKALAFINQRAADASPFFLLLSVYGPHGPSTPARRHLDTLPDLTYPKKSSFKEKDLSDKPSAVRSLEALGAQLDNADVDNLYRRRVQSLQSVDEMVGEVIRQLEQNGQLDNTYIFFTSDNGFHIGEHGLPSGKGTAYEEDIRVPLLVRGPGIQSNLKITPMVANVDLAPTIAEMTGVAVADFVDGRSFLPFLQPQTQQPVEWRTGLPIEMGAWTAPKSALIPISLLAPSSQTTTFEYPDSVYDAYLQQIGGGAYRGVRTEKFLYVEYQNGELEYYDLRADPDQLNNRASSLDPKILSSLRTWLGQLKTCAAAECRKIEANPPSGLEIIGDTP